MHTKLAQEPKSTEEATQRIIKILDAKYEKADLQAIVKNNCSHLDSNKQNFCWRCSQNLSHFLMEP